MYIVVIKSIRGQKIAPSIQNEWFVAKFSLYIVSRYVHFISFQDTKRLAGIVLGAKK